MEKVLEDKLPEKINGKWKYRRRVGNTKKDLGGMKELKDPVNKKKFMYEKYCCCNKCGILEVDEEG